MKYLFEEEGLKFLDSFCYADALFAFDFDGTLAPIVVNPDDAGVSPSTDDYLRSLYEKAQIVIISGRGRQDLLKRLPFKVDFALGNHGLEGLPSSTGSLDAAAAMTRAWHETLRGPLDEIPGVFIEDKNYSLALHYRQAHDHPIVQQRLMDIAQQLLPAPRIVPGKFVLNLVALAAPHKGVALLELMQRIGKQAAVYVGDDDNDEDVFRLGETSLLTIRVGEHETSAASYYLKDQSEIDRLLQHCLDIYTKTGRKRSS